MPRLNLIVRVNGILQRTVGSDYAANYPAKIVD